MVVVGGRVTQRAALVTWRALQLVLFTHKYSLSATLCRVSLKMDMETLRLTAEETWEQNKKWKEEMMEQQVSVWQWSDQTDIVLWACRRDLGHL